MEIEVQAEELIQGVVEAEGLELVHLEFQGKGAGSILRILIDKPGGVGISDCQKVSRQAGVLLDVEDLIPFHYTLEVSSPGLDRPLFKAGDYVRFTGREVRIVTEEKVDERRKFTGVLLGIDGDAVRLECDGEDHLLPLSLIKKANLVYRFE
jgi:ribosome maturation factor RimP